jgi:hypothetical protein
MSGQQGPPGGDRHSKFRDRVKQWREDATAEALSGILRECGCQDMTMDQVAVRTGISKGSLVSGYQLQD